MTRYKLYVEGQTFLDRDGNTSGYKIVTGRNAKQMAKNYKQNVTVTDMNGYVITKANWDAESKKPYLMPVKKGERIDG
jgi:hypothetical protein